jgi:hypothetical protein
LDGGVTYTLESFPFYNGPFPINISGDYVRNLAAHTGLHNDGYSAGFTLGKAGKKGLWELNYRWTQLGADAWYEELVESDFGAFYRTAPVGGAAGYRSGTNVRGHWIKGTYNVWDSFSFSVAYFLTELVNENPAGLSSQTGRLFIEGVWKF